MCFRRCGRVRKKHHCEADEDPTRQWLQRRVSAVQYTYQTDSLATWTRQSCVFSLRKKKDYYCYIRPRRATLSMPGYRRAVNAFSLCQGTAAPVGPSIPCKAANIFTSPSPRLPFFKPPFSLNMHAHFLYMREDHRLSDCQIIPPVSCLM